MPVSKQKKQEIWQDVTSVLENKGAIVFVNFHGLNMSETTSMRKKLKAAGVTYLVAKKSIVKKILQSKGFAGELPALTGELAIAASEDMLVAPRELYAFQKQFDGRFMVLGGVYENSYAAKTSVEALATIPPLPVLRGMFVNVINSPIQGFVIALDAIAKKKTA